MSRPPTHSEAVKATRTREYISWCSMNGRCNNPNDPSFQHYGKRGISVCERWRTYLNFLADMGRRPANTSLDRIENDGNYEPSNCRWATSKQQRTNSRRFKRKACKRGHLWENPYVYMQANGKERRYCRECYVVRRAIRKAQ